MIGPARGNPPGHQLDRHVRRIDAVEFFVGRLEYADDACDVAMAARIVVERNGQLALLADIAEISGKDQRHAVLGAAGFAKRRRRLGGKLA